VSATTEAPNKAERAWLAEVGMRVRLGRVRLRESQERLGDRAGVGRATVGSIERGDHPAVVLAYTQLARALDLPVAVLLDGAP
jgi:transcriptional regulator with XRE-family HTH domain